MAGIIGNVGLLDLTEATADALAAVDAVENAGSVVYTEAQQALLDSLRIENTGGTFKVPIGCVVINGPLTIDRNYVEGIDTPASYFANGPLRVADDVDPGDFDRAIGSLYVNGPASCPKALFALVRKKIKQLNGVLKVADASEESAEQAGRSEKKTIRVLGSEVVDAADLARLDEPVRYKVMGILEISGEIETELLERIESIQLLGRLTIREEYLDTLKPRITGPGRGNLFVIPSGHEYHSGPLTLDGEALASLQGAKLCTRRLLRFTDDVTPDMVSRSVTAIRAAGPVICPTALREHVSALCSEPLPTILHYSTSLLLVEGDHRLGQSELRFQPERFSLVVLGDLVIDADVGAEELDERLEFVDNLGEIKSSDAVYGLLQARARTRRGEFVNLDKPPESTSEYLIENVGYLKL